MDLLNPAAGGLSNAKLALANAAASDVLSGKKFYSGDKTLKTGTFTPTQIKSGIQTFNRHSSGFEIEIGFVPTISALYIYVPDAGEDLFFGCKYFKYGPLNPTLLSRFCYAGDISRSSVEVTITGTKLVLTGINYNTYSTGQASYCFVS